MAENYIGFNPYSNVKSYLTLLRNNYRKIHFDVLKLICVLQGSAVVSDSFSDYLLNQNDVHIINPSYPYFIHELGADSPSTLLVVEIDMQHYYQFFPELNNSIYLTCTADPGNLLIADYLKYLRFLMSKIYFFYNDENVVNCELEKTTKHLINFLLEHFYCYIFEPDSAGNYKVVLNTTTKEPYDPARIYRIIDYIYDYYSEDIGLDDIAAIEFLSKSYTSKFIKQASGLTFSEHLSMARCEQAEKLLLTTSKSIDSIAEEVGFANRQHLNINFKRWFKMSPSQYKKRYLTHLNRKIEVENKENNVDLSKVLPILKYYLDYA